MPTENREPIGRGDGQAQHVVVGVDGSSPSRQAIDWAIQHAASDDVVEFVYTRQQPATAAEAGAVTDPLMLVKGRNALLDREIEFVRSRYEVLPQLRGRVIEGPAGASLIDAAAEADLIVVGTRGRGNVAGLLLGSTSTYLAHHATCPLVIVPASGAR